MNKAHKHDVQLLEPGEDGPKSFKPSEEALDFIASAIHDTVVLPELAPIGFGWDNRDEPQIQREPFFKYAGAVGLNLDYGAVQRHCLDAYTHELRALQLLEHPVQHTALAPAVHAGVERMPITKALRQAAPLAAMLGHVQNGIEYGEVVQADIAPLHRQAMSNLIELGLGNFHA